MLSDARLTLYELCGAVTDRFSGQAAVQCKNHGVNDGGDVNLLGLGNAACTAFQRQRAENDVDQGNDFIHCDNSIAGTITDAQSRHGCWRAAWFHRCRCCGDDLAEHGRTETFVDFLPDGISYLDCERKLSRVSRLAGQYPPSLRQVKGLCVAFHGG